MSTILPLPSSPHCRPTTARFFFICDGDWCEGLGIEVLVDRVRNLALIDETDDLLPDLPVLKQQQRRDTANIEAGRCGAIRVDVQLADFHASLEFRRNRVHCRCQRTARSA